jgi:hypothetical protein
MGDRPGWLVLERSTFECHPGSSTVRLTLLNAKGEVRAKTEFRIGHRCYLGGASIDRLPSGIPVVELTTGLGGGPGPNIACQYYALIGDQFALIRIEQHDGTVGRNSYYVNHFACGPEPPKQAEVRWAADLCGPDQARMMRALVWLGGQHRLVMAGEPNDVQFENVEQAQLARRVRSRSEVVAQLLKLVAVGSVWEREAAQLVLHPEDAKW